MQTIEASWFQIDPAFFGMKVLIGITTHNRAEILAKAIQSALEQDYQDKEIAVFDDASTDGTPLVKERFPQCRWYRAETNQGYLAGRNKLMRETDADLYFSLDDDAWFLKGDEVSHSVALMKERPEIAVLAYDILSPDRTQPVERAKPLKTHLFIGCGHMLRLSAVREISFYTPNPGNYGAEESDLCVRLLDRQYEIFFLPGVHVWHDKSSLARQSNKQYSSAVCNDLTFAFRRCPFPMILAGLPVKLLSHFRFAIKHNFFRAFLSGLRMFVNALPSTVSTRAPVSNSAMLEFRRRSRLQPLQID
ncbi:MAG: glycosyltransferase family 2 protein [Pyrinomonadaceae bacterium]